jgi:dihydrofolate reductase
LTRVSLIAAVASNGVIGAQRRMPWRLSTDQKRFRQLTLGKPVIMGRKTFEAIGKPLDGRVNIVITRQPDFQPDGARTVPDVETALALGEELARHSKDREVMVIGGGEVYAATIERAGRLYITHVEVEPEGDTHFPGIDPAIWRVVSEEHVPAGERDSAPTRFVVYDRTSP